jgi:hypothetical protein
VSPSPRRAGARGRVNDVALIVAGSLSLLAAVVHGVGGELLVVRKLSPGTLPPSTFGGPRLTKAMIHASWHLTTVGFVTVACALLLAGSVLDGDAARAMGVLAAGACTAFAAVVLGLGAASGSRSLVRHPAPLLLTATAALAWWGAL